MHTELCSNNMPITRNYVLLCLRCHQRMLSYNFKTVSLLYTNGLRKMDSRKTQTNRKLFYFRRSQRVKGLSVISTIDAAGSTVALFSKIKLLAVTLDGNLNSNDQVKNVCRPSFIRIRALRHIRPSLTGEMANVVACALVQSRVDYAYSLYTGMSSVNFDKLQLVQNILARVVTLTKKLDHIQPSLKRLHWLPIRQRVHFKVALLTYSIRYSGEPQHLNWLLMDYKPTRFLRSAEEHLLVVSRTKLSSTSRAISIAALRLLE